MDVHFLADFFRNANRVILHHGGRLSYRGDHNIVYLNNIIMAFSSRLIFLILLFIAVTLEVFSDILFKKWSLGSKNSLLIIGLIIYMIGTGFWAVSLKYEFLSKAISVFAVLNLIVLVLVGVVLFKEDLSFINKIGIGLGVLSVILIEI